MPFPSSAGTKTRSLSESWTYLRSLSSIIESHAKKLRDAIGPVDATTVIAVTGELARARKNFATALGTPGLTDYAKSQIAEPSLDVDAEGAAVLVAVDAVVDWVVANFPKDANGWLLAMSFDPAKKGETIVRKITAAQLSGLVPLLDALIASID